MNEEQADKLINVLEELVRTQHNIEMHLKEVIPLPERSKNIFAKLVRFKLAITSNDFYPGLTETQKQFIKNLDAR